jgi:hypothetical protein
MNTDAAYPPTPVGILQELAVEVRSKTVQLFDYAPADKLTWAPPGTSNPILWHAGHAVWLQDVLCIAIATGKSELPAGWAAVFGMGSRPERPTHAWPAKDDVRRQLKVQLPRLVDVIGRLTPEELTALPRFGHPGDDRTLQECIIHGLHDEANHQGEMYLLLKIATKQS